MAFLRNKTFDVGTRVRSKRPIEIIAGTFTAGHEFTIMSSAGYRGWNLKDDQGNQLGEVGVLGGSMNDLFDIID